MKAKEISQALFERAVAFESIQSLADAKEWRIDLVYGADFAYGITLEEFHWLAHMQGWIGVDRDPARAILKCRMAAAQHLLKLLPDPKPDS